MKRAKKQIREYPVEITSLTSIEGDCFGNEWESTHKTCMSCSDFDICLIVTNSKNYHKRHDNFLDMLDWDKVPWADIFVQIIDNPMQVSIKELRSTVKELSGCLDDVTVMYKVQNWLIENNIKEDKGCLYL